MNAVKFKVVMLVLLAVCTGSLSKAQNIDERIGIAMNSSGQKRPERLKEGDPKVKIPL